ncbi:uncharacterized protein LOC119456114 isoform X1 [Dermacentor silvarum]|uniref:uncharacterized protein LOC119456114 isoform X1 n=2 Tax=Dermacentor silvarum TaxID=543639 RepID=UPI00189AC1F3|nr:uncharacterized protein LOC119456114 isoform X1 [Dermacentor silvarum]
MTETRLLLTIMHIVSLVFGDEAPFNVCLMHSHEVEALVTCAKADADMPEKVLNHWNDQIAMFTGMSDAEVVLLICKTSLDAGEALYEEFSNTHPEYKKTIDVIVAQCYEKATGQKIT